MQLPTSTTHLEYDLCILCGPYVQPFFVHVFLGDVPDNIDYNLPIEHPSWVAQQYIMPHSPDALAANAPAAAACDLSPPHHQHHQHHHVTGEQLPPAESESSSSSAVPHLPFLHHSITASLCLNPFLLTRLHLSSPTDLTASAVTPYLHDNLQWRLVAVHPERKELNVKDVPVRLWVKQCEVTPLPEGRWGPPTVGREETVWDATEGKGGGLRKGEMPEGQT
ncbi:MAG: hypothetical protein M1839_002722 [Geoglossum umbratile]|nr:MAG: hypothetical protein M1839_002722 [Geoglossum umbratile]